MPLPVKWYQILKYRFKYYICEKLSCRTMAAYGHGNPLLNDHGRRFVCILFFLTRGLRDIGVSSDRVFEELKVGSMDQRLARAELVQYLEDLPQPPILYNRTTNEVSLTREGLEWARGQCETPVYQIYRHLQN